MNRHIQSHSTASRQLFRAIHVAALPVLCGLLGCASPSTQSKSEAECKPENIYHRSDALPSGLRRVAVLPLGTDETRDGMIAGRDELEPLLSDELIKAKRFEVVRPAPEELESRTGRPTWTGEEALPQHLLASLREMYGCDAVLFCRLTVFRPYGTLAVGWRMKLVETGSGRILWAADEVFDNGEPAVRETARQFQRHRDEPKERADGWVAWTSPRAFGQFSLAQLFATLPDSATFEDIENFEPPAQAANDGDMTAIFKEHLRRAGYP